MLRVIDQQTVFIGERRLGFSERDTVRPPPIQLLRYRAAAEAVRGSAAASAR